jgi:predicted esterase
MPIVTIRTHLFLLATAILFGSSNANAQQDEEQALRELFQVQLQQAGQNEAELIKALTEVPAQQREGVKFLIFNLGPADLRRVSAQLLLDNVRLAYEAKSKMRWGDQIPEEMFFNDVLPYFNVDETRESWRGKLYEICSPIVADCQTPSEAAQRLNEQLFTKIGVKYSTARNKANQSPSESMEQGLASCTGLSVLLTDACRSVCIPARVAGIPSWPNKRGNHTWVEIWDGQWYFTGAAEPSARGLNDTWFLNDVALADKSSRLHSVYAVSFRKTETEFPLVWSRDSDPVYAVNVTDRYADPDRIAAFRSKEKSVQALIRIWNEDRTQRRSVQVFVFGVGDDKTELKGESRNNEADMNDMLAFELEKDSQYDLHIVNGAEVVTRHVETGKESPQLIEISLPDEKKPAEEVPVAVTKSAVGFFAASEEDRNNWTFSAEAETAYAANPRDFRSSIWTAYQVSPLGRASKEDFEGNRVTFKEYQSPYTIKEVGKRPKNGWPLFIAMHGGGGAPKQVNDSQWEHMQIYYKDQADVEGYKYLALRAPNDTWNGFYDDYVYPLIENLIRQFIVFGDIDRDKVFIMGYSHGGYGAFAIGPKIPYRFAAIHASAAAPTDGETSARTLRNTRFTFMVGEKDDAYGRRERCEKFAQQIKQLKGDRDDIYPVEFLFKAGFGHGGLPDRDMISQMYSYTRNVVPKHLTWELTDSVVNRFYWLATDEPAKSKLIDAEINDNAITVATENVDRFWIFLDERLVDPGAPVKIQINGQPIKQVEYKPDLATFCRSLEQTGDISLSFDCKIECQTK